MIVITIVTLAMNQVSLGNIITQLKLDNLKAEI